MKKYLSTAFLAMATATTLLGSVEKYKEILDLYNSQQYEKAYKGFKDLSQTQESKRINFYLGRTAFELGKFDEALEYYKKVLFEDPENLRVRFEIARTHIQLGDKQRAKQELRYLLDEELPETIKGYVARALENLQESKDYSFNNTLLIGVGYDDNTKSTTGDSYQVFIPQLKQNFRVSPSKEVAGATYELALISNYTKKLQEEFYLNLNLVGFDQGYFKNSLDNNESELISIGVTPIIANKEYQLAIKFSYDHLWYGHKSYLNNYSIIPSLSKKFGDNFINTASMRYSRKSFIQSANNYGDPTGSVIDDTQKDSRTYEISNKLSYHSKTVGVMALEAALGRETDLDNVRVDIDKKYALLALSNSYQVNKNLQLYLQAEYKKTEFENYDPNFKSYREDNNYRFSLGWNFSLSESISIGATYGYIKNISNFTPYEYNKNIIKSNLEYRF